MSHFLTNESLDFARKHIESYYDTDFFPKPFEFIALWYKWDEVKKYVRSKSVAEIFEATPLVAPWRKTRGGYRIVHQLEPLDAIVYTAMAYIIAQKVEQNRAPIDVACSYRIKIEEGSLFAYGSGFDIYRTQCEYLASTYAFVLLTDISDFYNQIYLHRVGNAIATVTEDHDIAFQIEKFLDRLNTNASQGVPVGPAASIVMTEAVLIDVDQYIESNGFKHVRYVDDFRIFGNAESELDDFLQKLAVYIYENHRLTLVSEKTKIIDSEAFLQSELNNQYQLEKLEILGEIETINPYSMEVEEWEDEEEDEEELGEDIGAKLLDALERISKYDNLDLGLARAIIRRAKAHSIDDIVEFILDSIEFFTPVINDVALYFDQITSDSFIEKFGDKLSRMCADSMFHSQMVRLWMEWYFSEHKKYLKYAKIRDFLKSSKRVIGQARAAILEKNQAWVKDKKTSILHYATRDRRAVIYASKILSKDEREHWLKPFLKGTQMSLTDKWVIEWVLAGCPDSNFVDIDKLDALL